MRETDRLSFFIRICYFMFVFIPEFFLCVTNSSHFQQNLANLSKHESLALQSYVESKQEDCLCPVFIVVFRFKYITSTCCHFPSRCGGEYSSSPDIVRQMSSHLNHDSHGQVRERSHEPSSERFKQFHFHGRNWMKKDNWWLGKSYFIDWTPILASFCYSFCFVLQPSVRWAVEPDFPAKGGKNTHEPPVKFLYKSNHSVTQSVTHQ